MSAEPPPYRPHFPEGPSAPAFSPALACQPGVFPSSPYQTFPQSYYHEHPGYMAPMTPQSTFGGQSGASYPPKHAGRSKVTIQRAQAGHVTSCPSSLRGGSAAGSGRRQEVMSGGVLDSPVLLLPLGPADSAPLLTSDLPSHSRL
ncbi:uncharacterized protein LOC134635828 isoform X1 [Pelmatolapia mariae]|uniref:uncharacterized protein LOC134635828 isoform X1 n=1 Tax=Pelmatolapia mariae TaxID=158779 RepID=UPI002FE6114E